VRVRASARRPEFITTNLEHGDKRVKVAVHERLFVPRLRRTHEPVRVRVRVPQVQRTRRPTFLGHGLDARMQDILLAFVVVERLDLVSEEPRQQQPVDGRGRVDDDGRIWLVQHSAPPEAFDRRGCQRRHPFEEQVQDRGVHEGAVDEDGRRRGGHLTWQFRVLRDPIGFSACLELRAPSFYSPYWTRAGRRRAGCEAKEIPGSFKNFERV